MKPLDAELQSHSHRPLDTARDWLNKFDRVSLATVVSTCQRLYNPTQARACAAAIRLLNSWAWSPELGS